MTDIPIAAICACLDAEARAILFVTHTCLGCGTEFTVRPNNRYTARFCKRPDCQREKERVTRREVEARRIRRRR